ncbi:MAG: enolase C-terminal domain-like protein, partial [Candidatus Latescibacterota bacterium]|nr:enolase C-terminal domain-like protein [Candidatus Latescibacterota bacterium]
MSAVAIRLKEARFYMRNVRTRMPFKYGVAVLTSVPILHVVARGELADGTPVEGVAADILPPKWFDKDPAKDYEDNVDDLRFAARVGYAAYRDAARAPKPFFAIWQEGYAQTLAAGDARGLNRLTAAHGSTLMERALIDAVGRGVGASYFELLKGNLLGLDLGAIHPELAGVEPAQVLGPAPLARLHIRHTVGLADPITVGDIPAEERLDDGLPQALEEYVERQGLTYFKVKVNGDLAGDLERLTAIAALLDESRAAYQVTLDGNEQYRDMERFIELLARIEAALPRFYGSILYIEQPLERSVALDPSLEAGIRAVGARRSMLIDESDEELDTFRRALELGYQGVSSKACKGLVKALANLALAKRRVGCFLSGEDL